jgi:hypothetical protein
MRLPAIKQDSQGTVIRPGQKVAYNRSGDVVPGEVINVQNSHVKILAEDRRAHYPKVSKVKNGRSILVLDEPPGDLLKYP